MSARQEMFKYLLKFCANMPMKVWTAPVADASSPYVLTAVPRPRSWTTESRPPVVQIPPRSIRRVAIWFGIALAALLGVGIVGTLAAGPKPDSGSGTTFETTTTTVASTTTVAATVPATTAVQTAPATAVPVPAAVAFMTAEVVDGDTIAMSDGSRVRLIGIDTPEQGECGADEASALLAGLITGQTITLVPGARDDVDRYGRLLRYVEANGVDAGLMMIESGRAIARYDGRDGYGVHPRQDAYVEADDLTPSINICTAVTVAPLAVVPFAAVPVTEPPPAAVFYENCTAVRAAGAAPIRAGDPGWQTKFDRDGDGIGCE
jgi:endonuclease YncB( thermonuclease family)